MKIREKMEKRKVYCQFSFILKLTKKFKMNKKKSGSIWVNYSLFMAGLSPHLCDNYTLF